MTTKREPYTPGHLSHSASTLKCSGILTIWPQSQFDKCDVCGASVAPGAAGRRQYDAGRLIRCRCVEHSETADEARLGALTVYLPVPAELSALTHPKPRS